MIPSYNSKCFKVSIISSVSSKNVLKPKFLFREMKRSRLLWLCFKIVWNQIEFKCYEPSFLNSVSLLHELVIRLRFCSNPLYVTSLPWYSLVYMCPSPFDSLIWRQTPSVLCYPWDRCVAEVSCTRCCSRPVLRMKGCNDNTTQCLGTTQWFGYKQRLYFSTPEIDA